MAFSKDQKLTPAKEECDPSPPPPPYSAFSRSRNIFIAGVVTAAGFFGPISGAIYLPSLLLFESIFSTSQTVINATVSVYMAFFAVSPLLWAQYADYGGRKAVYIVSLGIFLFSNILLAVLPPNVPTLFILRIFQAIGSCAVTSVGAGTIVDIYMPSKRASAMSIFLLGPQMGPILGPLIGGQFASPSRWRWIFGFLAITCAPIYLFFLFLFPETLRCLVGNGAVYANQGWLSLPRLRQRPLVDSNKFPRPPKPTIMAFVAILKYPPHLIVTINSAILFATLYAMYITFPSAFQDIYGFSETEVGYAYLSPGIAMMAASLIAGKISDWRRASMKKKNGDKPVAPESRVSIQIYGFILAVAGTVMYGWFCRYKIHAAGVLVAAAISSAGMMWTLVTSISFQTERDPQQAASLIALGGLMRNIAAAISAVIINRLVELMGYGWCFTGLAIIDLLCIFGVLVIMAKGEAFQKRRLEKIHVLA